MSFGGPVRFTPFQVRIFYGCGMRGQELCCVCVSTKTNCIWYGPVGRTGKVPGLPFQTEGVQKHAPAGMGLAVFGIACNRKTARTELNPNLVCAAAAQPDFEQ